MKTVGVNRAPARIRHSGRAENSSRDTLKKKRKWVLHFVVSEHPGSGLDPPIGLDQKGVLQLSGIIA